MLHRPGRFDRLRQIRELDPVRDCHEIYRSTALWEFPFDVRMGLLLAFWRTFAVPSIAELLAATGETTSRTERRADDTGILMYTLIEHGLDHPLGRAATRRLNQLHRRYAIDNDDYLYVLGTFVFVGTRWLDRYGWRPLCCHERTAIYHFYAELGRRMNIRAIPPDLASYASWYDRFEAERFASTPAAQRLITATKGLLADLPKPLVTIGGRVADALLDPPLREALSVTPPPWWARALLAGGLAGRARYLRHAAAPRERPYLDGGLRAKTYPDGFDIATVGPAERRRPTGAELRVEAVHRLDSRNLLMLSGRHSGGPLAVGDAVAIRTPDGGTIRATVRAVELHGRPGSTTVGVDPGSHEIPAGSVVLRST